MGNSSIKSGKITGGKLPLLELCNIIIKGVRNHLQKSRRLL